MIVDRFGVQLTPEEEEEFIDDLWDAGIPPLKETIRQLWEKWGDRMGIPEPRPLGDIR